MKFGTSGLRGLSVDLVAGGASIYANAFGRYLIESGKAKLGDPIFVGRDFRDSSPAIAAICVEVLKDVGFEVCDCGTAPTPALAHYSMRKSAASLMVTGSHIPADRNGIKFYNPDGEIAKPDEAAITALAANARTTKAYVDQGLANQDHAGKCLDLFYQRNIGLLPVGALSGLKIGVYQHSTVAGDFIAEVLAYYGARVVPLGRSATFIAVDTEAVSNETIALLADWTKLYGLDAIVSADGMATGRLSPMNAAFPCAATSSECGRTVPVCRCGRYPGDVQLRYQALGVPVRRTRVGSPFVIAGMKEALAAGKERVVGFEANGGLLTASACSVRGHLIDPLPTRDCMLPILVAVSLIASRNEPLSTIARSYNLPITASDRLENFPTADGIRLIDHLRASEANLAFFLKDAGDVASRNDVDGVRVALVDKRIIHFRASGNAPEMRCYVEAATETAAMTLLGIGLDRLRHWVSAKGGASEGGDR